MNDDSRTGIADKVRWHASENADTWAQLAAGAIAQALQHDLDRGGRALLLLSGGNTPAPVYRALGDADLDWPRVHVGLVDERWTAPESTGSNARLVRETLLASRAAAVAAFTPLVDAVDDPALAARRAGDWLASLRIDPSAIVFGMGDDGHTASLFPRAAGLEHALATRDAYAAIDASGCEGAGNWPTRITATPALFERAASRLLLIHGATKRRVFERALAGDDVAELPVRAAIAGATPLQVHWYP